MPIPDISLVFLSKEHIIHIYNEYHNGKNRQYEGHIAAHPFLNLCALSAVGFGNEVIPAPAVAHGTEKYKGK